MSWQDLTAKHQTIKEYEFMIKHPCAACDKDSKDYFHEDPDGLGDYWFCENCMKSLENPREKDIAEFLEKNLIEAALRIRDENNKQVKPT